MIIHRALRRWGPLFLISNTSLFLELAVIRWLSAEVRLFAYFKNLALLAAFLGLAIGFGLVRRARDYRPAFAPLLGLYVILVLLVGRAASPLPLAYPSRDDEFLWLAGDFSFWLELGLFLGVLLVFFLLTTFIFVPLGQATGKEMAHHAPTPAYVVNILGSLGGVWVFALLSYLQAPPAAWFGLALVGQGAYWAGKRALSRTTCVIFALVLIALVLTGQGIIWSPYHRLDVDELFVSRESDGEPVKAGHTLMVQQVFYQHAIDLSPRFLAELNGEVPEMEGIAYSYNLPYRLAPRGAQVLIVGAGMGNDVAAALRQGATHVDAVEIDPAILALGHDLHPEHPYDDARVTPILDDARSYFEKTATRYDVVAFGLLDSHTLLSGLAHVRLDSFVYTTESFVQVRDHLDENGLVAVTFADADAPWISERLGRILGRVFGSANVFVYRGNLGTVFIAGAVPSQAQESGLAAWEPDPAFDDLPLTTDDWPYLYLRTRKIPAAYWQTILLIGAACAAIIARSFPQALRPNWHFWLLGAAFLLIEFKSITELALLFGTTWLVNALAISGVLFMALVANLFVLWRPTPNLRLVYVLLFASLALSHFFPLNLLAGLSPALRAITGAGLLTLPLFFAGLIFGESLRRAGESARPLASNLSGAVAGGVLEYGSLLWGINSLYGIASILYVVAMIVSWQRHRDAQC